MASSGELSKSDLTAKQEAFALAYVETGNAAEAYRRAYDVRSQTQHSTIYSAASRLMADPKIAARVNELQEQAVELALYSKKQALEEYETARAGAMEDGQFGAAVSAVTGKAKLFGFHSDRHQMEHTGKDGGPIQTEEVRFDAENFAGRISRLAAQSGAGAGDGEPEHGSEGGA